MPAQESSVKALVSVSEMADLCQISRSRWYELIEAGVFPKPIQIPTAKRPVYDRTLQEKCLEIRSTGVGNNGHPVLFNRKPEKKSKVQRPARQPDQHVEPIMEAVKALGLTTTLQAVKDALDELYPKGCADLDQGEVIRKVFLHLQGKGR